MKVSFMTLDNFVFDLPLYKKVDKEDYESLSKRLSTQDDSILIEGYNSFRKTDSTFYLSKGLADERVCYVDNLYGHEYYDGDYEYHQELFDETGAKTVRFKCKRYDDEITLLIYHNPSESIIMKVGQYPSVADIHIGKVKQYDKVMERPDVKEFTRAIGLAANGVGIGSFVYLRRIFEMLVLEAFNSAKEIEKFDIKQFEEQKMDEKIKSLREYLPPFVVEHRSIYGILSKGIHELTEEECLAYFDTMRISIESILDQQIELRERIRKEEEAKKQINEVERRLKQQ